MQISEVIFKFYMPRKYLLPCIGSYAYLEFEKSYHPDQLPQIFKTDFIRHLYEQQGPSLDDFARTEIVIPYELLTLISSFGHPSQQTELQSFNEHLKVIIRNTQVYGINLSSDKSRIVILGPLNRLKSAAIAVEVFLNH